MSGTEAGSIEETLRKRPDNYLFQSIVVMFLCFFPVGIPAVVFASRVNIRWDEGDFEGAAAASRKAKLFCWIAFVIGFVGQIAGWIILLAKGII